MFDRLTPGADRGRILGGLLLATCLGACSSTSGTAAPGRGSGLPGGGGTPSAEQPGGAASTGDPSNGTSAAAADASSAGDTDASSGDDAAADAALVCPNDPSIEVYHSNFSQMGQSGQIQFVLVNAQPAPPRVGINAFTLRLLDASGNAIPAATFPTIKLWMPYMRHGSSIVPSVMPNGDGTYGINTIDLIMAGVWQFTFTAQSGSMKDTTMYTFCIHGP